MNRGRKGQSRAMSGITFHLRGRMHGRLPSRIRPRAASCARTATAIMLLGVMGVAAVFAQNPNDPGILEPVLSELTGVEMGIPNTDQTFDGVQLNIAGEVAEADAVGSLSLLGEVIRARRAPRRIWRNGSTCWRQPPRTGTPMRCRRSRSICWISYRERRAEKYTTGSRCSIITGALSFRSTYRTNTR